MQARALFSSWHTLFLTSGGECHPAVWGWLLGYKWINFLRRCKEKTNMDRCKNLCSWPMEPEHWCHPVLLRRPLPRGSQTLQGLSGISCCSLLLLCPAPWSLIPWPESKTLQSPVQEVIRCKVYFVCFRKIQVREWYFINTEFDELFPKTDEEEIENFAMDQVKAAPEQC